MDDGEGVQYLCTTDGTCCCGQFLALPPTTATILRVLLQMIRGVKLLTITIEGGRVSGAIKVFQNNVFCKPCRIVPGLPKFFSLLDDIEIIIIVINDKSRITP